MKIKYMSDSCRPVIRDGDDDFYAGVYFAGIMARREYGRRGHVGPCRLEAWTEDGRCFEFDAFIGVPNGDGMTGHNIRFSVITERIEERKRG